MCEFIIGEYFEHLLHGRDRRWNCVVLWTTDLHTLMYRAGSSTPLLVVQVPFISPCEQKVHVVLRCLHCPSSPSFSHLTVRNTHTLTQSVRPCAQSKDTLVLCYRRANKCRSTDFTVLFLSEACKFVQTKLARNGQIHSINLLHSLNDRRRRCAKTRRCPI